jgi:long-chain acyl-CoA synthetase
VAGTVTELWSAAVARQPATPAYLSRIRGDWREIAWNEAGREVDELAAGFLARGVHAGERVALLARTRLEWAACDWALISIGALVVPIYPTTSALEIAYILGNSGARVVVCENETQAAKLEPARRDLEALEQVIVMDGAGTTLEEVRARGRVALGADPGLVERARAAIAEDDPLTIVYTSGTSGPPKGCVLTQRNYRSMVDGVLEIEGLIESRDRALLHLPLAHTFARLISFVGAATGLTIAFVPDATGIAPALTAVRPTLLPSVPRLFETFQSAIRSGVEASPPRRRALGEWALRTGSGGIRGTAADLLVLRKLRARLGGRLRLAISGGAPLPADVARFFDGIGVRILEGYGLTECTTVVAVNRPGRSKPGTVGPPLPGVDVRIAPDGEILVHGPCVFAGYYRDEEATRAVLAPDGWLATGDLGSLDEDGFLTVSGRKKDIIVTAGGKNVSPQNVEDALESSRYIAEAVVVGDRRPYLVALIVPDLDAAGDRDDLRTLLNAEVRRVNRELGQAEQVRRFAILPRALSQEQSELTPTLKVRRHVVEEHFRDEIERLYPR